MGKLVLAAKITHVPSMYLSEQDGPAGFRGGGESGPGCRPFDWDWARDLRDQCVNSGAAFWMKQGGGHPNKRHQLSDLPEDLRVSLQKLSLPALTEHEPRENLDA